MRHPIATDAHGRRGVCNDPVAASTDHAHAIRISKTRLDGLHEIAGSRDFLCARERFGRAETDASVIVRMLPISRSGLWVTRRCVYWIVADPGGV
jgi:hypothetical protein